MPPPPTVLNNRHITTRPRYTTCEGTRVEGDSEVAASNVKHWDRTSSDLAVHHCLGYCEFPLL